MGSGELRKESLVLYCLIGKVMEVRSFIHAPRDWQSDL